MFVAGSCEFLVTEDYISADLRSIFNTEYMTHWSSSTLYTETKEQFRKSASSSRRFTVPRESVFSNLTIPKLKVPPGTAVRGHTQHLEWYVR
jgi:hypothetical protein